MFGSKLNYHYFIINIQTMPRNMLEKIGVLFPFTNFLRIGNEMEMTSSCGGISAILVIIGVIGIFVSELVTVFQMKTITSSSESSINLQPPMINITTNQNNPLQKPYMIALSYFQDSFYTSDAVTTARYIHIQGPSSGNRTITETPITLQTCTVEHFSSIPGIQEKQTTWGISNWQCLPLNQSWQIGGDYELSSDYRRIDINMTCARAQNFVDCGYYKLYTLNSFVNPSDPLSPITYYISQDTILVKAQAYYEYSSRLNQNNLTVDESVTPLASLSSINSFESNPAAVQTVMNKAPRYQTVLKIQSSGQITYYKRSFYKLLTALSFVGGIFNSILAIFFFMVLFLRFLFEMKFAEYYFNNDEARDVSFFSWIQQALFSVLKGTCCQPEWQVTDKRLLLRQTVNKVLDIFYLHKRIAFLQRAIQIVLNKHQIKGLHLAHNLTTEQSQDNWKNYRLRDRVLLFLNKYTKTSTFGSMARIKSQGSDKQVPGSANNIAGGREIGGRKPIMIQKSGIRHQAEMDGQDEDTLNEMAEIQKILASEVRNIGQMTDEQLDEDGLAEQMSNDLKLLFEQGQLKDGDERSKKVCSMLQSWLMQGLKMASKQHLFTNHLIRRFSSE